MNRWCRDCKVVWHDGLVCWNCGKPTGKYIHVGDCCREYCIANVHTYGNSVLLAAAGLA